MIVFQTSQVHNIIKDINNFNCPSLKQKKKKKHMLQSLPSLNNNQKPQQTNYNISYRHSPKNFHHIHQPTYI